MASVSLTINGQPYKLDVDGRASLLDALRDTAGLTGVKKGCDHGQCGACTVLVDGKRELSCLSFAVMHEGNKITTIEGLESADRHLHPMQQAFRPTMPSNAGIARRDRSFQPSPASTKAMPQTTRISANI